MTNYRIHYSALDFLDGVIKKGQIIVKGAKNGVHAQIRLEQRLKRMYPTMKRMVVHNCEEDYLSQMGDLMKKFLND
jgi:hypothetical protein